MQFVTNGVETRAIIDGTYSHWKALGYTWDWDRDTKGDASAPVFLVSAALGDGTTDATAGIQAAIDAANTAGGGVVALPKGSYKLTASLVPKDGVSVVGAGTGATKLLPYGLFCAFRVERTSGSPLVDAHFSGFTIDGINQSGTYNPSSLKGFFIAYLSRCTFRDLYIANTGATGLGIDYLNGVDIANVRTKDTGRLNGGSDPGGAGIGIGCGAWANEPFTVRGCHTVGGTRFGIFTEKLAANYSKGGRIIGNTVESSGQSGIVDGGCDGLVIASNTVLSPGAGGIGVTTGTIGVPGKNTLISGNVVRDAGTHGIRIETTLSSTVGGHVIRGNEVVDSVGTGIKLDLGGTAIADILIQGNKVIRSGSLGIHATGGGGFLTGLDIDGNQVIDSGLTNGSGFTAGIRIENNYSNLWIHRNQCYDTKSAGARKQGYGIHIGSGTTQTDARVENNHCYNNLTAELLLNHTWAGASRVDGNPVYNFGSGTPEAAVAAPVGTVFYRTNGGAATTLYVKESGTGNTGWVAK